MSHAYTTLLVACLAASSNFNPQASALQSSSSSDITASATLVANAPAAKDVQGVHLLLENDVDFKTPKNPNWQVTRSNRYWIYNGSGNSTSKCMAFDRKSGHTLQLSCSIKLPALCTNSLPRYRAGVNIDKSKQIKAKTPQCGHLARLPTTTGQPAVPETHALQPKKYGGNNKVNDATEFEHAYYCLSSFGLFENTPEIPRSKAPGNLATRDHIAALRWVHDNIVAFGGDPSQVTILRENAGGWSMRALLSAPSAFGLYKNVISQSGPIGIPFSSPKYSSNLSKLVMQSLNCTTSDLACARNRTADQVTAAQVKAISTFLKKPENQWVLPAAVYRPAVDKSLILADFADLLKSGKYNKNANILWGCPLHPASHRSLHDIRKDRQPQPSQELS
ncbi:hypothetical protein BGX30_013959 [Mortierella sp. GBA39]|nr:hypothetical protein BGX30_013959 [Mortierella sp. GBA39]